MRSEIVNAPLRIAITDYGMGNIRSVHNAFAKLGCDVVTSDDPAELSAADAIVLPGVGAFGEAVANLQQRDLVSPLIEMATDQQKPFLGICLGMQLLANVSHERGSFEGLGLIPGEIQRLDVPSDLRLPHIGWNSVHLSNQATLFSDIVEDSSFYFVHGYHFVCDKQYVSATTEYGGDVVAAVERGNVFGVQFHPERSQSKGLTLLANFVKVVEQALERAA